MEVDVGLWEASDGSFLSLMLLNAETVEVFQCIESDSLDSTWLCYLRHVAHPESLFKVQILLTQVHTILLRETSSENSTELTTISCFKEENARWMSINSVRMIDLALCNYMRLLANKNVTRTKRK